jgi:hypothetical protein
MSLYMRMTLGMEKGFSRMICEKSIRMFIPRRKPSLI